MNAKYSKIVITYNNVSLKYKESLDHVNDIEEQETSSAEAEQEVIEETTNFESADIINNAVTEEHDSMNNPHEPTTKSDIENSDISNLSDIGLKEEITDNTDIIEDLDLEEYFENEQVENISDDKIAEDTVDYISEEEIMNDENSNIQEDTIVLQTPICTDQINNCSSLIKDPAKKAAFDYEIEMDESECHDICVEDVRDICVMKRTFRQVIPCTTDDRASCRGDYLLNGPPEIQSWRVLCAEADLSPSTGCDRINNKIEFEVIIKFGSTIVVFTPKDEFACMYHQFARFPSGVFYPNTTYGLSLFNNELAQIDGSCKIVMIEDVFTETPLGGNDCFVVIKYKVVDKLWKHENLLISAIKPYAALSENFNFTIKQEFAQGHIIGTCPDGSCSEI